MALTQRTFLSSSLFIFLGMFFTLSMFFMKEQSYVYSTEHLCNRTSIGRKFLMSPVISSTHAKCDRWKRLSESVQNCISDKLRSVKSGELWFYVSPIVETCATLLRDVLNTTFLSNKDDVKGFIDFVEETDKLNCVLVTIGIGGDILSEEKLKDRLPKCRLYGADPINASGEIYTKVGKYYQLAVSDVSGSKLANVLTNPEKIFTYSVAKVPHISFKDFLQIKANVNVVDFLFLDGEGSEYKILPQMQIGGELDRGNITICQLSVELHGPVEDYGFTKDQWDLFMRNFLLKSNYLPLWTPYPANHHRMFFVNYANRICIDKFFKYWC